VPGSVASEPWWGEAPLLDPIPLPATADAVVVGAGILGLASAYWLARGGIRPLLLDQEGIGAGATGRNGGFIPVGLAEDHDALADRLGRDAARQLLALTLENRRLMEAVIDEEELACDFRPAGHLHLFLSQQEQAGGGRLARMLTDDGSPVDTLTRSQAQELVGTRLGPRIVGGQFFRDIALVHSGKLVQGLARAAARRGATLARAAVLSIGGQAGLAEVRTDRGTVSTPRLIVANNAWMSRLVPDLGRLITPVRGQAVAFAPIPPTFRSGMTARVTPTEEYWQQTLDGSIILGGCRTVRPDHDEGILDCRPTAEVQAALEQVLPPLFPQLGQLRVTHRWAGPMGFTADRLPVLTCIPERSAWAAGGFSGHGMSLTMVLGAQLASLALGQDGDPRLRYFHPSRLGGP
jgi:glycine/D-amino acid oxidase-like deaminating enzyme